MNEIMFSKDVLPRPIPTNPVAADGMRQMLARRKMTAQKSATGLLPSRSNF